MPGVDAFLTFARLHKRLRSICEMQLSRCAEYLPSAPPARDICVAQGALSTVACVYKPVSATSCPATCDAWCQCANCQGRVANSYAQTSGALSLPFAHVALSRFRRPRCRRKHVKDQDPGATFPPRRGLPLPSALSQLSSTPQP